MESVLAQTHADLELIIVDDGSTDRTGDIVHGLADGRVRYIKLDRNHGQSAARNIGVRQARADLIAFQDSDDVWLPEKLAGQLAYMHDDDIAGVYCDLLRIASSGDHFIIAAPEPVVGSILNRSGDNYQTYGIGIQSCLLRKPAFDAVGGFRENMHCLEDLELLLRIARRWPLRHMAEVQVHYHQTDGVSGNAWADMQSRIGMLRRYGAHVGMSNPGFILGELRMIASLWLRASRS